MLRFTLAPARDFRYQLRDTPDVGRPLTVDELQDLAARRPCRGTVPTHAFSDIASRMPRMSGDVLAWFKQALSHPEHRWFAANLLAVTTSGRRLARELILAAIRELDPSLNRAFVRPLVGVLSWSEAVRLMMELADSPLEVGGVARAAYWMKIDLCEDSEDASRDLNTWLLRRFISCADVVARRCIIAALRFEDHLVTPEEVHLIDTAIGIAANHPDEYIRHRLKIQLGRGEGLYMPLVTE